jgi:hypothetical protein
MGFFNILETFFFISLAITFVLIMMLVYHFKGRISILEQKSDTMFEIMNNIVKEMRTIKSSSVNQCMIVPNNETMRFNQHHNLGEMFQQFHEEDSDEDDDDDDDENNSEDNQEEIKRIVVSDTEYEDEQPVKIINIEFNEKDQSINNLEDFEEETINMEDELEESLEAEAEAGDEQEHDAEVEADSAQEASHDYKKMDISYLRTMVITRGLATDTKKMKKNDLIKLLEDSKE